jgi:hypothetical protein
MTLHASAPAGQGDATPEQRLERGEILYYAACPFPIAAGADRAFLLDQRLGRGHKNISYDPHTGRTAGFCHQDAARAERLQRLLADFSRTATAWLASQLPHHAAAWRLDQVSFRPEQEATRKLRHNARNDLLHVDAFPSRPTNGHRILRLFVNVNPSEPRVWATAEPFPRLLERFAATVGLPGRQRLGLEGVFTSILGLFKPAVRQRSIYDSFMLRFHDFLKANEAFQKGPKKFWNFAPGSCWVVFTDMVSHAALRGRFALEHSYFVSPDGLVLPELSPANVLARVSGMPVVRKAA